MRSFKNAVAFFLAVVLLLPASLPTSLAESTSLVHGIVVDEEGLGLSNVSVQAYTSSGAFIAATSTGSNGSFNIWLDFGMDNLYLTKPEYAKTTNSINVQGIYTDLGTLVLGRPLKLSTSTVSLIATPGDKISIPFTVSNFGEDPEVVEFQVSSPQEWSVSVIDQSAEVTKVYMTSGQNLALQLDVTVPSAAPVNRDYNVSLTAIGSTNSSLTFTVIARAQSTADFFGRTVDEYDNGIEGVNIQISSSDGALIESTTSSSDGSFSIEQQTPNTFSLYFSKEGYADVTKNVVLKGENVNLGEIVLAKTLKLYSSILDVVVSPGNSLLIPFVVSNLGKESETIILSSNNAGGWPTRILNQNNQESSESTLASGTSMNFQLEVTVPFDSKASNNLTLTVFGKTNSSLDFIVKVQQSNQTVISCQFPGKSTQSGDTVQYQLKVTNPTDVEQLFNVSVSSTPNDWTASTKNTGGEAVDEMTLGGGETQNLVVEVSTPTNVDGGTYSLIFTVKSKWISESLPLILNVQKPTAGITLQAVPPYADIYGGSEARFKLDLSNFGGYNELLNLTAEGLPQGFRAWFEDATKQEITKVYVQAGQSTEFYLVVSTPKGVKLSAQSFSTSVANAGLKETVDLTLNMLGQFDVSVTNQNFYTSLNVGGQSTFTLTVLNNGSQEITNVKAAMGTAPDGFTVSVDPASLSSLGIDQEGTFTFTVLTQSSVNAGNYYIDFNVMSDQTAQQSFTLRVETLQGTNWIIYAGILVVIAIVALLMIYRRFGRR